MEMKIQAAVIWAMTPCSDVAEYQRFGTGSKALQHTGILPHSITPQKTDT